ncbi:polysaccharide deacetylase family protein [Geomonas sp. Red32]|uniref:polysaccharide deacetylase family protein n=1 Tax=Geomonas sp. Red32 TaxID=2912856 RepID=UPI00202D00A5|nr:polysaccharide deacetylase family protein [Geomonas sp. Red32]MCM0083484.1 polysaccharide deacetylase family protein [Geomonas sp. Red32]
MERGATAQGPFLLAVNYHYIGAADRYPYPGIIGVTPSEFEAQLDEMGRHVEFVGADAIERALSGNRALPENAAVVTFDDGLKEQFALALPILEARRIPFIFFVNSAPLAERRPCFVHKVHYLRSVISSEEFLARARLVAERKLSFSFPEIDASSIGPSFYPYDEPPARALKYTLNFLLSPEHAATIVDEMFSEQADEAEFCSWFYLNADEARELHGRFRALGVHGHSHLSLASLPEQEARREIGRCAEILGEVAGAPLSCISYPFGYRQSVSPRVAELAGEYSMKFGFTMESCFNWDVSLQPLLLGRINNNEAPGHRQAAFRFSGEGPVIDNPSRMSMHRTWFAKERVPFPAEATP